MKFQTFQTRRSGFFYTTVLVLAQSVWASPTDKIYTPKPGSRERKAILDALRKPVTAFNNKSVIFTRVDLKAVKGWAYVYAASVDAKGKPVGPPFTNSVSALLRNRQSQWRVLEWAYATDVISIDWEKKHPQVPKKLWPHRR